MRPVSLHHSAASPLPLPSPEPATSTTTVRLVLPFRTVLMILLMMAMVWLYLQLWQLLVVIVVALMIVGMLSPLVSRLEQRLKRNLAIAVVFVGFLLAFGGLGALTVPRLVEQVVGVGSAFPQTRDRLAGLLEERSMTRPLAGPLRKLGTADVVEKAQELGVSYGSVVVEGLAYTLTAFFLALYVMIDRDRLRGGLYAMVPRRFHVRLSRVLVNLEIIVGGYMRGQLITSAMMMTFAFVVLVIAGVPNPLALAIFAGIADVLPYIGALLVCIPASLAALSQGTTTALVVLATLAAYQEIESRLIVPRVYGSVLRLPAAVVMLSLLVGGKLLGVLGALLALPIAAAILMVVSELRVELPGEDIDDRAIRKKDARAEAEFEARAAGVPAAEAAAIASEIAAHIVAEDTKAEGEAKAALEPLTSGKTPD